MRTILAVLAVLALTACGSTDNQYQSPYAGSQTVGPRESNTGQFHLKGSKEVSRDQMQQSADKINNRKYR